MSRCRRYCEYNAVPLFAPSAPLLPFLPSWLTSRTFPLHPNTVCVLLPTVTVCRYSDNGWLLALAMSHCSHPPPSPFAVLRSPFHYSLHTLERQSHGLRFLQFTANDHQRLILSDLPSQTGPSGPPDMDCIPRSNVVQSYRAEYCAEYTRSSVVPMYVLSMHERNRSLL